MKRKNHHTKENNQEQVNWSTYPTTNTYSLQTGSLENNLRNLVGSIIEVAKPFLEDLINNIISSKQESQIHPEPMDELLSVEEAAALLGVTPATIHSWKKKGIIRFKRIGRRVYLYKKELLASNNPG